MTDCSIRTEEGRFDFRVRAVIVRNGKLLAMHDERSPYYYLTGGRVAIGETAEEAVLREVKEELGIDAEIDRALWLDQNFFTEAVDGGRYHEIVLYYLLKIGDGELKENEFVRYEGKHTFRFEWLPFESLQKEYFYPTFMKSEIFNLPQHLKMIIEKE